MEWIKDERLPAPTGEGGSAVKERLTNRALEWCLAHQKRMKDGKWEVDPNKPETIQVVKRVMEELEKGANEMERGTSGTPEERGVDALTKALGKKDHRGYVKALGWSGVGVGHLKAFGKVDRKRERAKEREEFEKRIKQKVEERLQERLALEVKERVAEEVQAYLGSLSTLKMPSNKHK